MTNVSEMMNQVVEVLVKNGMTVTGGKRKLFKSFNDFKVCEVELLEHLLQFDGAFEKFAELTESKKGESASIPIWKLDLYLNSIHNFGYHNSSKVEVLDTIEDISEINLKPRHTVFLNILKNIKPDIEKEFVTAYNQTQPHLNPFRVEQVLFYLRDLLECEGIKTSYSDFMAAVQHTFTGDWKPYFCKSNFGYIVVDINGHYNGKTFLMHEDIDKTKPLQWWYTSSISPDKWYCNKVLADITVTKLRELRDFAGFSKDLDWEVVYANVEDFRKTDPLKDLSYKEHLFAKKHEIVTVEISKGCIGKHRKASKEIYQKYETMIKEINVAWRVKAGVLA